MHPVPDTFIPPGSASRPLFRLPVLLVALALAGMAAAQQAPPDISAEHAVGQMPMRYRVINLAATTATAAAPDINAKGQVVFATGDSGGGTASYFFDGSAVQKIGTLGGNEVVAVDMNDLGQVTGRATTATGAQHAFLWSTGGGMYDIGAAARVGYSVAAAINAHSVVTGSFQRGAVHAFRWSLGTGLEDLGVLAGGDESFGNALNDAGDIGGMATTADNARHAFLWTRSGGLADIDTLNSYDALPLAVGANGEVAGNRLPSRLGGKYRAFLWTRTTGMIDIGAGGGTPVVLAMTPGLHMAGVIGLDAGPERAMSWTPATGTRNLGTLGGQSSRARAVNNKGLIVGFAQNAAGKERAFLWSPQHGMQDLNQYLHHAPPGLVLNDALAINDGGAIVAASNAGLVLLRPFQKHGCGHALGPMVAPSMIKAGMPLQASLAFVDDEHIGTRSVTWSWDEGGSAQAGQLHESGGAGSTSASHSYSVPGIYRVTATVVDSKGRSTAVSHDVVVVASASATLAGAGVLMSPAGALAQAPLYAGKASFRLIAPTDASAQAARVPALLQFDLPGLHFRSQDVRPLARQGAQQAFEGGGTVGGAGAYRFRLLTSAAVPGSERSSFVLKIWHTDPARHTDVVDYDNARGPSGAAAGQVTDGNIVLE